MEKRDKDKIRTPWGMSQNAIELAPGIIDYNTAGHGGIWLSAKRRKDLNYGNNFLGTSEWWEEDIDWAVPYAFFADDIQKHGTAYKFESNLKTAISTVKSHHPNAMPMIEEKWKK